MPDRLQELDDAVRQVYDAFAIRPRRARIAFCDHCVSPQDAEALVQTPIRKIGAELLQAYVLNAVSETWGNWDDLWCYLPRILELVASGDLDSYDISGLFTLMGILWRDWPQAQQNAIIRYLGTLWRVTIAGYWHPGKLDVIEVLEAAGDLGVPVDSYLRTWETDSSEPAALHLAWLIRNLRDPREEWSRSIGRWLSGPAPKRILTQALGTAGTPGVATTLSAALGNTDSQGRSTA